MSHVHNIDPANGLVCSHAVTEEMLIAWGIVNPPGDNDVDWVPCHGFGFELAPSNKAIHRARMADRVRICTLDPRETRIDMTAKIDATRAKGVAALPFWEAIVQRDALPGAA